jgi:hypothetical protein
MKDSIVGRGFLRLGLVLLLLVGAAVGQAGNIEITIGADTFAGTLLVDGGVHKVAINGVVMQGWTWVVMDTDGDGLDDDVRVTEPGGGILDLADAGNPANNPGTSHDGNAPYNPTGNPPHPNQIGTWKR